MTGSDDERCQRRVRTQPGLVLPLRVQITTAFLILFGVIALAAGTMAGRSTQALVDESVRASFSGSAELALQELRRLENTARGAAAALAATPLAAATDNRARREHLYVLATVLSAVPGVSAAYVGWPDGDFLLLRPMGPHAARLAAPEGARWLAQWVFDSGPRFDFLDARLNTLEAREGVTYALDPRTRPWFRQAAATSRTIVTAPYIFYTTREPGITAARRGASGAIAGIDVSLRDISARLPSQQPASGTEAAVLGPDDAVIAYSEPERILRLLGETRLADPARDDARLPEVAALGVPVLTALAASEVGATAAPRRLAVGGADWLGVVSPLDDQGMRLAMAVPVAGLAAVPQAMRTRLLQLFGIVAMIAAPLVWWAGRLLARPVERFTAEVERVAALEFSESPAVRTRVSEMADLGRALDTARIALGRFSAICQAVFAEDHDQRLLAGVVDALVDHGGARRCAAWLRDGESGFRLIAARPPADEGPIGEGLARRLAGSDDLTVVTLSGDAAEGGPLAPGGEAVTVLGVVLRDGAGEAMGVIALVPGDDGASAALRSLARFIARHVSMVLERQRLVSERAAAREETEIVLGAMAEGLYVLDAEGRIQRQNAAARALAGADAATVAGEPFTAWIRPCEGEADAALHTLADGRRRSVRHAWLRRVAEADPLPVAYECAALEAGDGTIRGAVVSFRDVGEQLRAEYALRERVKELNCLYRVLEATVEPDRALAEVCASVVETLPAAMLHDAVAVACVRVGRERFTSPGWDDAEETCSATIWGDDGPIGEVAVGYRERRPSLLAREATFLPEERAMVEAVAAHLGRFVNVQRTAAQLRQSERLSAVGELTGGVAHDFNNLLTVILGAAENLGASLPEDDSGRAQAIMIRTAAERGADLTRHLIAFARRQSLAPRPTRVEEVLAGMCPLLERTLGDDIGVELVVCAAPRPALVDPAQLENALLNLCLNARDAMPDGGGLQIELRGVAMDSAHADWGEDALPGHYVCLSVTDTGAGMDEETTAHAFEPFFTTKEAGAGSGLGLSMVYGFMRQSGGFARLDSAPGAGTTVRLYLPEAADEAGDGGAAASAAGEGGGGEHILLVEDDALVREHTADVLQGLGYRVTSARDGREALGMLRGASDFDLLFSDVVMPGGLDGYALAEAVGRVRPGLPVLLTSGYPDRVQAHDDAGTSAHFLRKPYRRAELAAKLREVLVNA
ncbi:ATP-binding protein [Spiribacter halobius]|uniref:histidine kinase n=1 Tax=Sediminicurvatus halobius TaxID=2182432 RepID=A0A2U2N5X7_9GAMM|nr:ATP-binding protein [Spiribacter halobius]PWG64379.1 hypothetical protein DEM34_05730 [Spiribacter halobius]UEX79273.1 response regulator [Spiribacter halobius]